MLTRRVLLGSAVVGPAMPAIVRAQGNVPIRIGEINSYTAAPAFTLPYRNGWMLAVEELNARGGVAGRKIEVISRDDAGQLQNATQLAGELLSDAKVDLRWRAASRPMLGWRLATSPPTTASFTSPASR